MRRAWSTALLMSLVIAGCGDDETTTATTGEPTFEPAAWSESGTATRPTERYQMGMAADTTRDVLVLFGGNDNDMPSGNRSDTWEWDGGSWSLASPMGNPGARNRPGLAHHAGAGHVLLFGGSIIGGMGEGDTWIYDGTAWTEVMPDVSPPARLEHAMAYDADREVVVMFGGTSGGAAVLGDVWEWDGSAWLAITPTDPEGDGDPEARAGATLAYDAKRKVMLLFGGQGADILDDAWSWDGASWKAHPKPSGDTTDTWPQGRRNHGTAYDGLRGQVVIYGGTTPTTTSAETWGWTGTEFERLARGMAAPPARASLAMGYHPGTESIVIFGGRFMGDWLDDTWILK